MIHRIETGLKHFRTEASRTRTIKIVEIASDPEAGSPELVLQNVTDIPSAKQDFCGHMQIDMME